MSHAPTPASAGCAVKPAISARPKTVSVNGVVIPREAIARETQNHPAAKPIEAWQAAARALAIRALLLQEAQRLGLASEPAVDDEGRRETDEEALIRSLIEREVAVPKPDEATCRRFYEQNRKRFRSPDLHAAAHILIAAAPGDAQARAEARIAAEGVLAELAGQPERFAALALAHSACPSRAVGGSLGQISPGQTVPEFETALARMEPGHVHPSPIESRYGFHVIRLDHRVEGRDLPYEAVAGRIADYLTDAVSRTAARQYVSLLAGRAVLEGVALDATSSPLMQ
jgi:peptidyl-prolyl cis-trans isomerase C